MVPHGSAVEEELVCMQNLVPAQTAKVHSWGVLPCATINQAAKPKLTSNSLGPPKNVLRACS